VDPLVADMAIPKIAYGFLVFHLGSVVYDPRLDSIREALLKATVAPEVKAFLTWWCRSGSSASPRDSRKAYPEVAPLRARVSVDIALRQLARRSTERRATVSARRWLPPVSWYAADRADTRGAVVRTGFRKPGVAR
jgi:hypothetical protein